MAEPRRVLLVGGGAEEVCEALDAGGAEVTWLAEADDESVRDALESGRPDLVCVATRDDAFPLRIALLVRHLDEDVPLLVTIFDPGMAEQIADTVPNCRVTSLADIVAPTLAGPCTEVDDGPKWFKVAIGCSVILTLLSAASFTGGLINRFVDSSLTGLFGRRAVPRRDHVIVIGLGQVGLRLCVLLRECGVLVVAVDADPRSETVGLARRLNIPVVIGRGANPAVLRRLSPRSARAFAAVTDRDLVNIESALTARSLNADLRVILRAGDGELADETRSLLRIGHVIDVHRLGAAYIAGVALGSDADAIAVRDTTPELLLPDGGHEAFPLEIAK